MKHPSRFEPLTRARRTTAWVCLLLVCVSSRAGAQAASPVASSVGPAERWIETRRIDRLEASIAELANSDGLVRRWGGVGAFVIGGVVIAGGIALAVDDDGRWGGRGQAAVSGLAWAAGASLIAAGVYRWLTRTPAEDRLERWSELRRTGKLDVIEFARFEGELATEAELASFDRRLAVFTSFGLVAAGGGLIALGASSELDDDSSTDAYVLGGVAVGVGVIQSIALLLTRTPAERAFRHYREGGGGFFSVLRPSLDSPRLVFRSM